MRAFLITVGIGFLLLGLLAALTILGVEAWGIKPRSHESSLLLLAALCSMGGFLAFALTSRRVRIYLEWKQAYSDSKSRPGRKDSESKQAHKEFDTMKAADRKTLWNGAGVALLVLGLASATVILLTKTSISWFPAISSWFPARATLSLWLMFVPSTLLGHVAVLLAQEEVARQTTLIKKF